MDIHYLGHACFRLKGKPGMLITDPFHDYVGFSLPNLSADVVTVSHDHKDHNQTGAISGTSRRKSPFIIDTPGAYELMGISVFGVPSYHDETAGSERGKNSIFTILMDELRICHLGDLGHELTAEQLSQIGSVDILLVPVGGTFTIGPKQAVKVIKSLDPSIVIPMHYKTQQHDETAFGALKPLSDFLSEYAVEPETLKSLKIEKSQLPEETQLILLQS